MVGSKLSGRRSNAGTPRVTRAVRTCKHPPPGHSIFCSATPVTDPVHPFDIVTVEFQCSDSFYAPGDPLDRWDIHCSAGAWQSAPPQPGENFTIYFIDWQAPPYTGQVELTAHFFWPDLHSCQANYQISVIPPGP